MSGCCLLSSVRYETSELHVVACQAAIKPKSLHRPPLALQRSDALVSCTHSVVQIVVNSDAMVDSKPWAHLHQRAPQQPHHLVEHISLHLPQRRHQHLCTQGGISVTASSLQLPSCWRQSMLKHLAITLLATLTSPCSIWCQATSHSPQPARSEATSQAMPRALGARHTNP